MIYSLNTDRAGVQVTDEGWRLLDSAAECDCFRDWIPGDGNLASYVRGVEAIGVPVCRATAVAVVRKE